jgi:hypothetical protein
MLWYREEGPNEVKEVRVFRANFIR